MCKIFSNYHHMPLFCVQSQSAEYGKLVTNFWVNIRLVKIFVQNYYSKYIFLTTL